MKVSGSGILVSKRPMNIITQGRELPLNLSLWFVMGQHLKKCASFSTKHLLAIMYRPNHRLAQIQNCDQYKDKTWKEQYEIAGIELVPCEKTIRYA
jgi:hypothetical protein